MMCDKIKRVWACMFVELHLGFGFYACPHICIVVDFQPNISLHFSSILFVWIKGHKFSCCVCSLIDLVESRSIQLYYHVQ